MSINPYDDSLSSRFPSGLIRDKTFSWDTSTMPLVKQDLGKLAKLPFETIENVLLCLDVYTLLRLRTVSKAVKRTVDSLRQLRTLLDKTPNTFPILLAAHMITRLPCRDLYIALCRSTCEVCASPGAYLYLFTCKRLCRRCLTTRLRYRPLRPMQAASQFCLNLAQVRRLGPLCVPPLSPDAVILRKKRIVSSIMNTSHWELVDRDAARRISLRLHLTEGGIKRGVKEKRERWKENGKNTERLESYLEPPYAESSLSAAVLFPYYDRATGQVRRSIVCGLCTFYPHPGRNEMVFFEGAQELHMKQALRSGCYFRRST